MKNIMIVGKDSYIGVSAENWLLKTPGKYRVGVFDARGGAPSAGDLSGWDTVLHVAGIAHIKETKKNADLYFRVNRDLAADTARSAREAGADQFIFLSSMSVYGLRKGTIGKETEPNPRGAYGTSKLEAEKQIAAQETDSFAVAILRPPMVYGKGCKGNYARLASLTLKVPFFPDVENRRSMLYIDNLCEFVRQAAEHRARGIFFPQNEEYVSTAEMVREIAAVHGRKITLVKWMNPLVKKLPAAPAEKLFRDLIYEKDLSECPWKYHVCGFKRSIAETESEKKQK